MKHIILQASRHGYRSVVMNNRGCSGSTLKTARGYSASCTDDLKLAMDHIRRTLPEAPLIAVGISLGSMILIKYLGESGKKTPLLGAMAISNPWDIHAATLSLESFPSNYLYNFRLARKLK